MENHLIVKGQKVTPTDIFNSSIEFENIDGSTDMSIMCDYYASVEICKDERFTIRRRVYTSPLYYLTSNNDDILIERIYDGNSLNKYAFFKKNKFW